MQSHIGKLAEQCERRDHFKSSSSFSDFSSPHVVPLLVSELFSRPGPRHCHDISPSSTHGSVDAIVTSVSVTSPYMSATLALANPVMNSKPHMHLTQLFQDHMERVIMNLVIRGGGRTISNPLSSYRLSY